MKTKANLIFPAAIAAVLFALPCARAASTNATTANASTRAVTNVAPTSTATNAKSADVMTALFGNPVIARGKGFEIKRNELDTMMTGIRSSALARGQTIPPDRLTLIEKQILDRLIQIQILLTKATSDDKAAGKQKADLQITALLQRAGSPEAFERQLKIAGMTADDFRARVAEETTAQAVLDRELKVSVSDTNAQKFYDDHPAEFEEPEKTHVRHILLLTVDPVARQPLPPEQREAKHKQIVELLKRARSGEDFAKLATQYSEDPASKGNGGELPAFARGETSMPEFEAAAFTLNANTNQISDVVTTMYGYHIVKLLGKIPAQKIAYDKAAPNIKQFLLMQEEQKLAPPYLEKVKKESGVEILDPDLKALEAAPTNAPPAAPAAN